jgi:hypothetical protein
MKSFIALLLASASVFAATPNVGIVDDQEIFKKYAKAADLQAEIRKSEESAQASVNERIKAVEQLQTELQGIDKRGQDPMLSENGKKAVAAEFQQKNNASLYPNAQPNAAKFGLDPAKSDPLALFAKQREFSVPEGCAVFWHPRLLHGQTKTPLDEPIEFGMYVGYFAAGSRPEYLGACGTTELDDRIGSYTEGRAPKLWPSFDPVHFYPKRWQNFPNALEAQIARRTGPSVTTRVTKSGKTVPHLVPVPDPNYTPPVLSLTGMRLLGLVAY